MGFVFAYFGSRSRIPDWTLPTLDSTGWSEVKVKRFMIRTHPQDIAENSIDMNHLLHVHGWENGRQSLRTRIDGRHYSAGFSFTGQPNLPEIWRFRYDTDPVVHVWGLGFVYTESEAQSFGVRVRNWYLASPTDGDSFEAFTAVQIKRSPQTVSRPRFNPLGRFLDWLGGRIASSMIAYEAATEFSKDIVIWNHRRYEEYPALCSSDGELHKFRQYCQQFYPPGSSISPPGRGRPDTYGGLTDRDPQSCPVP